MRYLSLLLETAAGNTTADCQTWDQVDAKLNEKNLVKIISIPKDPCGNTKMLIYVHHRDMNAKESFRMAVKQEGIFEAVNLYVQRDSSSKTSIKHFTSFQVLIL